MRPSPNTDGLGREPAFWPALYRENLRFLRSQMLAPSLFQAMGVGRQRRKAGESERGRPKTEENKQKNSPETGLFYSLVGIDLLTEEC